MDTSTMAPAAIQPAAGAAPETCKGCTCFEGNSLSEACETCGPCHDCRMCSRSHTAPKNRLCPTPRLHISKTGGIWYAECPLTLVGVCNPKDGCRGEETLNGMHGWAMAHVAGHRAQLRDALIRAGVAALAELRKQQAILTGQGFTAEDVAASPMLSTRSDEAQRAFKTAVDELAQFLILTGERTAKASATSWALNLIRDQYDALTLHGLSEAA